jgi:hypothetical protein
VTTCFGTVLGYHTVAELKDLVAAKDAAMRNLARRLGEVSDSPKFDTASFIPAYNALISRYTIARDAAQKAIDAAADAWRSPSLIVAEEEWNNLLSALNPRWKENTWAPGDGSLEDLYGRVTDAGSIGTYDEPTPQPQQGTDVDFNVLQATTHATNALESGSDLFDKNHLIAYSLIGGTFLLFVLPKLMALSMAPSSMLLRR